MNPNQKKKLKKKKKKKVNKHNKVEEEFLDGFLQKIRLKYQL